MSLLFFDGFDYLNTGFGLLKYDNEVGDVDYTTGRNGNGRCARFYSADAFWKNFPENSSNTMIFGGAIKPIINTEDDIIKFMNNSVENVGLRITGTSQAKLYLNNVFLAASDINTVSLNNWAYFELKVVTDATVGLIEVRIDGEVVISESGINTLPPSGETFIDQIGFGWLDGRYEYLYFDDVYVCNGDGSDRNDYLGDVIVAPLYAASDGSISDFTPSEAGDHYLMVDDGQLVDASTNISSGTIGDKELFSMQSAPLSEEIYGLQFTVASIKSTGGSIATKALMKSGTIPTETEGNTIYAGYYFKGETLFFEKEPIDDVDWTASKVDAAEFGVKVESY